MNRLFSHRICFAKFSTIRRHQNNLGPVLLCGLLLAAACTPDSGQLDASARDSATSDAGVGDSSTSDTVIAGDTAVLDRANTDVADEDSATSPTTTAAIVGERCQNDARIGLIQIVNEFGSMRAWGQVFDKPNPIYGDYALEDEACGFHQANAAIDCEQCEVEQVCSAQAECTSPAVPNLSANMVLRSAGHEQSFDVDPNDAAMTGDVTLSGNTFSIVVQWANQTVTLDATEVPGELDNVVVHLSGQSEAPEGLDITWTAATGGGMAYTKIPINHHVGGLTFTECAVDASVGSLQVSQEMLVPLATITGLEFQSVEHMRFAAARTPLGCVELRLGSSTMVSPQ